MCTIFSGFPMHSRTGLTLVERGLVAADHDRQLRVDRADFAAADRRVEHRAALRRHQRREPFRRDRRDAAHVDDERLSAARTARRPAPVSTSSTSGVSGSIVMTMSDCRDVGRRAPRRLRRRRRARRSHPGCGCERSGDDPASRCFAIGLPMTPRPIKPMFSGTNPSLESASGLTAGH